MKRFFRFVVLGLILLAVAMVSALTAMRFAIHGREVSVPKLIGLSHSAAEVAANNVGLVLEIENRFYSSEIAEGKILSQLPAPGSRVRRGWRVRAAQSLGPQRTEIPNVVGESARAAEINVRRRGLEIGGIAMGKIPGAAADQIIAQTPPANAAAIESPKISVLMAAQTEEQQFVMPNFVGKHLADVAPQLEAAGFDLGHVSDSGSNAGGNSGPGASIADAGIISKQSPAAGQKIAAGATVSFEITR